MGGKREIITQHTLAGAGCDSPDCGHDHSVLFFHPTCHDEGMWAAYEKATGRLILVCRACEQPVAAFLIAVGGH